MKYYTRLLLAPALLLFSMATAYTQTPAPKAGAPAATAQASNPKIAIINRAAFVENIAELRALYEKLVAEFAPRQQELQNLRSAIEVKQEQLDKNGEKLTPQQIRKLQEDIEQLRKEGQRKQEDFQAEQQKREEAVTGSTYAKINEFLKKYTGEKGITIVWSEQAFETGILFYVDPKADITADFISYYNKANPPATAQNATTPTPAKQKP